MKKKIFYVFMIACIGMTAIINTSCSNGTDLVANRQQEKAGPKGVLISFGLSAEDYGTDNEAATRGVSDAQTGRVIATSTSNLGNGLEVLTEVVEDNAPKTRAGSQAVTPQAAPNQDYHILAYQGGKKKAEWYGNYSKDGKFSNYDQSLKVQYLEPGTYKFYVFSHTYMPILNDGTFTTDITKGSRNAFYIEEERQIPNKKDCTLKFVLKPMFARVRTKLKVYVEGGLNGAFNGASTYKAGTRYGKIINPQTGVTTYTTAPEDGRFFYGSFDKNIQTVTKDGITSYYIITPEIAGNFFLDGTKLSEVSFETGEGIKATIFGKPAGGIKMPTKLEKDKDVTLEAGKSYTLVYTMYKLGSYLFSDGTVTSLAEGKSAKKTPVGFVVDEKKRIAIALKNVEGKKQWATSKSRKATTLWPKTEQGLREGIKEYNGVDAERGGYKETWVQPVDQKVRAENEDFPAFYAIKNLPIVNGKKWYVPGAGDWALALKLFGIDDPAAGYTAGKQVKIPWSKATTQGLGYNYQNIVFTQAEGTPLNSWYWTANQWEANGGQTAITLITNTDGACFGGAMLTTSALVRPFINY